MSDGSGDDRWLASLDPIDVAEVKAMLDDDDLPGRIMALPAEPARRSGMARIRQAVDGRRRSWLSVPSPGLGRAAFATTVVAIVGATAALLTLSPNLGNNQEADPAGGDETPLSATTSTVLTASVPEDGPARADAIEPTDPLTDDATGVSTDQSPSPVESSAATVGQAISEPTASSAVASLDSATSTAPPSGAVSDRPTTSAGQPGQGSITLPTIGTSESTGRATTTRRPATTTSSPPPVPSTTAPPTTVARPGQDGGPFDPRRDLVALHFDHANYRDDGQATVAGKEIVEDLGLDVIVLGGTYSPANDNYIPESELVMDTTWGPNGWINAHANRAGAISTSAQRWMAVLERGGDVWVAEGGQSDLTADVVRSVATAMPSVDLGSRIHVVQHSVVNERRTTVDDLAFLRSTVDYIKIDDGNYDNATAKLRQQDDDFVQTARSGSLSAAWNAAFDYLDPAQTLDFSDTVELLHIVGIDRDTIADPEDFADYFID